MLIYSTWFTNTVEAFYEHTMDVLTIPAERFAGILCVWIAVEWYKGLYELAAGYFISSQRSDKLNFDGSFFMIFLDSL